MEGGGIAFGYVVKWHSTAPAVAQEDVTDESVDLERHWGIRVVLHVDPVGQLAMEPIQDFHCPGVWHS
jgi:hypothetical protein